MMKKYSLLTLSLVAVLSGAATLSLASWTPVNPNLYSANTVKAAKAYAGAIEASVQNRVDGIEDRIVKLESIDHLTDPTAPVPALEAPSTPPPVTGYTIQSTDFSDGTKGNFGAWVQSPGNFRIIDDPTGSGRGKILDLHYGPLSTDENNVALTLPTFTQGLGQSMFFRGDFYLPMSTLGSASIVRKLLYLKSYESWPLVQHRFNTVVMLTNTDDLKYDFTYEQTPGDADTGRRTGVIADSIHTRTWYRIEVEVTRESALGVADGIFRVWLNGTLVTEILDAKWSYSGWTDRPTSEMYFKDFLVGENVSTNGIAYDEHRYWDNVSFSTQRLP